MGPFSNPPIPNMHISPFRLLPIYPGVFALLGFKFQGKYYYDKCLPMGCSLSCAIFEKFSTFLEWATVENSGLDTLSHYLDDFIFAGSKGSGNCYNLMSSFQSICIEIGVPLAVEKTQGLVTSLTFLGIKIDTNQMCIRIPKEKILELKGLLEAFMVKERSKFVH